MLIDLRNCLVLSDAHRELIDRSANFTLPVQSAMTPCDLNKDPGPPAYRAFNCFVVMWRHFKLWVQCSSISVIDGSPYPRVHGNDCTKLVLSIRSELLINAVIDALHLYRSYCKRDEASIVEDVRWLDEFNGG